MAANCLKLLHCWNDSYGLLIIYIKNIEIQILVRMDITFEYTIYIYIYIYALYTYIYMYYIYIYIIKAVLITQLQIFFTNLFLYEQKYRALYIFEIY